MDDGLDYSTCLSSYNQTRLYISSPSWNRHGRWPQRPQLRQTCHEKQAQLIGNKKTMKPLNRVTGTWLTTPCAHYTYIHTYIEGSMKNSFKFDLSDLKIFQRNRTVSIIGCKFFSLCINIWCTYIHTYTHTHLRWFIKMSHNCLTATVWSVMYLVGDDWTTDVLARPCRALLHHRRQQTWLLFLVACRVEQHRQFPQKYSILPWHAITRHSC